MNTSALPGPLGGAVETGRTVAPIDLTSGEPADLLADVCGWGFGETPTAVRWEGPA